MMYLPAMTISLLVLVASVHRYNERQTSTVLTVLLTLPYTATTVLTRVIALAIILSVYPLFWSSVLGAGLVLALLVLNLACAQSRDEKEEEEEEERGSLCSCLLSKLPSMIGRALASVLSPLGYNNDR